MLGTTALSGPSVYGRLLLCLYPALVALYPAVAHALPQNGTVVAGQADIVVTSPTEMKVIQHSDKVAIDWTSFNIGANEVVLFIQNSALSQALNRVMSGGPSQILGQLTANGQIILSNAAGIDIGPLAKIDVQSLIATTANLSNRDFMAGHLNFDQPGNPTASVINQGEISVKEGGLAALVAPGVENAGVINARLGKVSLASGNTFTVDLYGDGLIKIAVDKKVLEAATGLNGKTLDALASNSGTINADGGIVQISANAAKNIVDNVINMSGTIRAQTAQMVNGQIVLSGGSNGVVNVAGTLDASGRGTGETGGTVKVLGDKVALADGTRIDTSGSDGGGTVMIGGNEHGQGPEQDASRTFVGADVAIASDAVNQGNGGQVVVWANDATAFNGQITAKGGAAGGNGGSAEVSGGNLAFRGNVDLSAPAGTTGTLLLDPQDIVIQGGKGDGTADTDTATDSFGDGTPGTVLFGDFAGSVTVRESEIEGLNANIVLDAANSVTATGSFSGGLKLKTGDSLTVETRNDPGDDTGSTQAAGIDLSAISKITTSGGGSITMATGTGANSATGAVASLTTGALTTAGGTISLNADNGGTITTGAITTKGGSNQAGGSVTLTGSGQVTTGAVNSSGGSASTGNIGQDAGAVSITGGDVTVGAVTASGSAANSHAVDGNGGNGGAITLKADDGTPTVTLGGNLTATGGAATGSGTAGNGGAVAVNSSAVLAANVTVDSTGAAGGGDGNQTFSGTIDGDAAGKRTLKLTGGGGDVTVAGVIGGADTLRSLTVTGNDISLAGIGTAGTAGVTGTTSVTASTVGSDIGSIAFTGTTYNANTQTYAADAGNTLLIDAGAATAFTASDNAISFDTGTLKLAGGSDLTVDSGGGAITIDGGIRGTSAESVTLTSGTGGGSIGVGPIGTDGAIGSVSITSGTGTTTLSGDIKTADVAGNGVTINGSVTNGVAVGDTLTIDTAGAANKGAITITGAVSGSGRSLTLTGGTVSTGAITTSGGSNAAGGSVTLTGSGQVATGAITAKGGSNAAGGSVTLTGGGQVTTGTINSSGGSVSTGNIGQDAGAVSITGGDVTVGAITASGSSANGRAVDGNGGSGGAITLKADDGTPTVTLGGNLTATGGSATGSGTAGDGGTVTVNGPAVLAANVTVDSTGATGGVDGNQTFSGTVDGDAAGTRTLKLTGGGGDVTVSGVIGGVDPLKELTVTGNDISLAGIGTSGTEGVTGTTSVTAATSGSDIGSIVLGGVVNTGNTQTYSGSGLPLSIAGDLIAADHNITINNPLALTNAAELSAGSGTIALNSTANAGSHDLTLTANKITLAGAVSGSGTLTLRPGTTGTDMVVGATGTSTSKLNLTTSELALIQPGFSGVTFGRSDSTATATVDAIGSGTLANPTTIISGTGPLSLAGDVATNGQSLTFDGPAQITADRTISTSGGNIAFTGDVTGTAAGRNLTLQAGSGGISVTGDVGTAAVPLGTVTADAGGNVAFTGTLTSGALNLANTPSATFSGAVNLTGTVTAPATVGNVAFQGGIVAGSASFANTGSLQLGDAAGDSTTIAAGLDTTGVGGSVSLGGTIATTNAALTIGALTLDADTTLNPDSGTLATGAITGSGKDLTIAGSGTATLAAVANVGTLALTKTGGSATITGNLSAAALTTAANPYDIALPGAAATITAATRFTNSGSLSLGGSGDNLTFAGGLDTTGVGGSVNLGGTIATTNAALATGAVTLNADTTLNAGSGTLTIGAVGGGSHDFTVVADRVNLNGNWTGTGAWTLEPATPSTSIGLAGGTGSFALDTTELARIANGDPSVLTIGRTDGTGTITANAFSLDDPLVLQGGPIALQGTLTKAAGALTLSSTGAITGAIDLATATGTLDVTGDSAVLTGTVDGLSGADAALHAEIVGTPGVGPYTVNGANFVNAPAPSASGSATTGEIDAANSQLLSVIRNADTSGSLVGGTAGGYSDTPSQVLAGGSAASQPYPVAASFNRFSLSALGSGTPSAGLPESGLQPAGGGNGMPTLAEELNIAIENANGFLENFLERP